MFLPKRSRVFESLVKQSSVVKKSAQTFRKITRHFKTLKKGCVALKTLEDKADKIVHTITAEAEKTFILPFDKEDISELTEHLDDIVDGIEQTANRLDIYEIPKSHKALIKFATLIAKATREIHQGTLLIQQHKLASREFVASYKKLHDIEGEGDKLHRSILRKLMSGDSDEFDNNRFLSVFKWKEVFQTLEETLDKCERIAILFERIRIKYR